MISVALLLLSAAAGDASNSTAPALDGAATSRQEARVKVQLDVDESGALEKCQIVETDAPAKLAERVCPIFLSKGKFKPAVDEKGKPKRSTIFQTVKFVLEK